MQKATLSSLTQKRSALRALASAPCRFVLVLASRGGVEVLEVRGATTTPRAWAAVPASASDTADTPDLSRIEPRLRRLRRALIGSPPLPVVIAGEREALRRLRDWLPRRLTSRLLTSVRVPWPLTSSEAIAQVRGRLGGCREAAAQQALEFRPAAALVA